MKRMRNLALDSGLLSQYKTLLEESDSEQLMTQIKHILNKFEMHCAIRKRGSAQDQDNTND